MKNKVRRGKYIGKDITGRDIYFGPQDNISKIYKESEDFIKRIFGIDVLFLSDESSLSDFTRSKNVNKDVVKKVNKIYDVDISSVNDKPIFEIVRFILNSGV